MLKSCTSITARNTGLDGGGTGRQVGCLRRGERRVSVSQPAPGHPTDEELSLHPSEQRSLPSPHLATIARYHPKKQSSLLGGPGRWSVKCTDILYSLSPDILYTCCQPVKRRRALLESNLAEE
jgi:hypothetical protein